ncbi:Alpha/Beta hydrolase protein [Phaeosphaeriaceae sp. PMI808]|nr:Alpha/Beta hydrolase protein [Phaeosphaeriaceae sp. PMI808]
MLYLPSLLVSVLFYAFITNAAPLISEKRGIQADQLSTFKLMQQYAVAAYCAANYNSPGDQISCPSGGCPLVEKADSATTIEYSREETATDVTGYVAVDHTNKMIVVAFRGSTSIDAWRTNFEFDTTDTDICSGCTAHRGFWSSWIDARDRVTPAVKQASTTNPSYRIAVVGHSLGGAIASLAAAQLRNYGLSVSLYNFGSPRIGGTKISDYISSQPGGNFRITHWNDPVPKLPLLTMGYVHISPEYYINKPNKQDVNPGDIQVYQGAANLRGNMAWLMIDVDAHRWYFSAMYGACDTKKNKRGLLEIRGVTEDIEIQATF